MQNKKLISFVFPVYNEALGINKLYSEIKSVAKELQKTYTTEIIFVNDSSKDRSLEKLIAIHHKDPSVHVISFSRNFGHQIAVTAGLEFAKGDAVIVMDSDLQDPPLVSLQLIKEWEKGFDVVYAQRRSRKDSFMKKITAHMFYRILDTIADIQIPKDTGDFRLMDRKVVEELLKFKEKNRYIRGLVSFIGFRQTGVLFDRSKRFSGKTNYSLNKMFTLALNGITSFSTTLLTLLLYIGFITSVFGFVGTGALIINQIGQLLVIPSFLSMFIVGMFFAGLQIFMLGIVGIYVGRIYTEVQNRPLYIVDAVYSHDRKTIALEEREHQFEKKLMNRYAIS